MVDKEGRPVVNVPAEAMTARLRDDSPVTCPYDSLDPAHLAHHPVLAAEIERLGTMYDEERWGDDR